MIEVDNKEVLLLFANLKPNKQKNVHRKTLKQAANILVKSTRQELKKSGIKKINTVHSPKNGGKPYSLQKGIKSFAWKNGEGATINILGDFRLKFFERGTNQRLTKKGWNRGTIGAKFFFKKAQQVKEKEILDNINNILSKNIQKISKK